MKIWQILALSTSLGFALPAVAQMAASAELRSDIELHVREQLARVDQKGNVLMTRDRIAAITDARMKAAAYAAFDAIDTNRDGVISAQERDAAGARRRPGSDPIG